VLVSTGYGEIRLLGMWGGGVFRTFVRATPRAPFPWAAPWPGERPFGPGSFRVDVTARL
jgi:hypothetical protein